MSESNSGDTEAKCDLCLEGAPTSTADEKSTNLAMIDMSKITVTGRPLHERKMRVRRLDVFPGGIIGLHDHANRPAILFVLHGSFTIHDSRSNTPHVVNEGEAVTEFGNLQHWAKNNSDRDPLAILTFDLLDDEV